MKTLLIFLTLIGMSHLSLAAGLDKGIKEKYMTGFKAAVKKTARRSFKPQMGQVQKIQLASDEDSKDDGIDSDLRKIEPIKFNKGRFKLVREYYVPDGAFEVKEETVCEGVVAVPVFDARNETNEEYFLDISQYAVCWGMLDGRYTRFMLGGTIMLAKGDHPLQPKGHQVEFKAFGANVFAEYIDSSNEIGFNDNAMSAWSGFATKNMGLNHAIMSLDRDIVYTSCIEPIEEVGPVEPVDPVEPIEPNIHLESSKEEDGSNSCSQTPKDFVTLTIELED